MKYITISLRVIIAYIGFHIMGLGNYNMESLEFYVGLGFILIVLYFLILSLVNSDKLSCPIADMYKNIKNSK